MNLGATLRIGDCGPTSSVKSTRRCSVSAGSGPLRNPMLSAPQTRPSTVIGMETLALIPSPWMLSARLAGGPLRSSMRAELPVCRTVERVPDGSSFTVSPNLMPRPSSLHRRGTSPSVGLERRTGTRGASRQLVGDGAKTSCGGVRGLPTSRLPERLVLLREPPRYPGLALCDRVATISVNPRSEIRVRGTGFSSRAALAPEAPGHHDRTATDERITTYRASPATAGCMCEVSNGPGARLRTYRR